MNPNGMVMKRYLQTTGKDKNNRKESLLVIQPDMVRMIKATIDDMSSQVLKKSKRFGKSGRPHCSD
jgi:hypothetical protein